MSAFFYFYIMRKIETFALKETLLFKKKLLSWAMHFSNFAFLDSNERGDGDYDVILGVGVVDHFQLVRTENSFDQLKIFVDKKKDWLFGYFSYDLKNELENLESKNADTLEFDDLSFFQPKFVFLLDENNVHIQYLKETKTEIYSIFDEILYFDDEWNKSRKTKIKLHAKITKKEYLENLKQIKKHIKRGDIYELNYCQEFYSEKIKINPLDIFSKLQKISPTPFSCLYKNNANYLLSASPERFLKKKGNKLISQPIKGTARRGKTKEEDDRIKEELRNNEKEQAENVMIVDLVRNDLSHTAERGTVQVDELFGVYTFSQVHQMISTVSSQLSKKYHFLDAIKKCFPPGSMTGAPKVRAMELIELFEKTKRGLYAGAVGYIDPEMNFDFNVVIRSILYNETKKYLSFIVGGAITDKSVPEQEFDECMLKAEAMRKTLLN